MAAATHHNPSGSTAAGNLGQLVLTCVAVTTGLPARLHFWIISFCGAEEGWGTAGRGLGHGRKKVGAWQGNVRARHGQGLSALGSAGAPAPQEPRRPVVQMSDSCPSCCQPGLPFQLYPPGLPFKSTCLRQEDLLCGDLHAQVAARNHDGVCGCRSKR